MISNRFSDGTEIGVEKPGSSNETTTDYRSRGLSPRELQNVTFDPSSVPETIETSDGYHSMAENDSPTVGTTKTFPSLNYTAGEYSFRNFTLRNYTENSSVWVAEDLSWPENDSRQTPTVTDAQIEYLTTEYEETMYPTNKRLFGAPDVRDGTDANLSEEGEVPEDYYRSPDGENRTIILVDNVRDENYFNESYPVFTSGFYSSVIERRIDRNVLTVDTYDWDSRLGSMDAPWRPDTNESTNTSEASVHAIEGTVTHELQHLIHDDHDPNETTWINEGMSEYVEYAAGYGFPQNHIDAFEKRPNNSLVEWGDQGAINILSDYGMAALFQMYLTQQYGESFTQELARNPDNGIESIETTLDEVGVNQDFYGVYQDFSTALIVESANGSVRTNDSDQYRFQGIDINVSMTNTTNERTPAWGSSFAVFENSVNDSLVKFSANGTEFRPLPWETVPPPNAETTANESNRSNETVLWGGRGNLMDNNAIMTADLRDTESATLSFETYYNIEQGWDYGFVQVSTDGGDTWTTLSNENTSEYLAEPESAYQPLTEHLPGFTGDTDGEWTTESFDLSAYSGQEVLISFRYMTDYATNGNSSSTPGTGWYLRNVEIPEVGISHDGSDTDPFRDSSEVHDERVKYQFTAVGITENGTAEVKQMDARTFTGSTNETWYDVFEGSEYDRIITTATWAARPNEIGTVPYEFSVTPLTEHIDDLINDIRYPWRYTALTSENDPFQTPVARPSVVAD
ncbi:immune inhibitor A domain-containing protein [Halocatena salina]|uniref:Immune inhibitor A n=1 Tax=Halocatena salina TaxID=2934340 RepID=A0A8U0A1E9_9EURY|nr:immune inhibitor A domain-containing protein [Halocatena salina]UPM42960.1 immune inhibitor A [Halocatena salina]